MSIRHFTLLLAILTIPCASYGQYNDTILVREVDSLKQQIRLLEQELHALRLQNASSTYLDEDIEHLEERFEQRMQDLEKKIGAVSRAGAPTAFNPRTTVFTNVAARIDDQPTTDAEGEIRIDDRPFLRSVEVDLRAPVDPYAEAVAILAVEDEAGIGFEVDPEEVYGILKRLPILETAPLGLKVKVGKYRAALGVNNRLHLHDVPWTTRPLVVSKYLGTEHGDFFESGYNPIGIDFDFFLPSPIPGSTLEMNLDVVRAGELAFSEERGATQPAYLGHLNWFKDWNNEHFLTLGLSGYYERARAVPRTRLLGADITYKWRPAERGSFRSFVAGGELFVGDHQFESGRRRNPVGWFTYAQYQLSWWLYIGARFDRVEEPDDPSLATTAWAGYLSYYTSEFLRLRFGYEHRKSDFPGSTPLNTMLFEINFVFGSHPVEPYWVNR
ncbi:MAG: hypothetical protein ACE5H0_02020 [Bacteroidota bacterium]